jgi:hypothetical protein
VNFTVAGFFSKAAKKAVSGSGVVLLAQSRTGGPQRRAPIGLRA